MYELTLKPTEREISLDELKNRIKSVACKFTEKKPEKSAYRPRNFGDVIRDIIYNQPLEQQHEAQFNQRLVEYDARRDTFLKACNVEIDNYITKEIADGRLKVTGEMISVEDLASASLANVIKTTQEPMPECECSFHGAALRIIVFREQSISSTSNAVTREIEMALARQKSLDENRLRGCKRLIIESWKDIELLHGTTADGINVNRMLERKNPARKYALHTVQNLLIELRKENLIP